LNRLGVEMSEKKERKTKKTTDIFKNRIPTEEVEIRGRLIEETFVSSSSVEAKKKEIKRKKTIKKES